MEEVNIAYELHRYIIGAKGRDVRRLMDEFDVNISVPPAEDRSDAVRITGPPTHVAKARQALLDKVQQLEDEKEQRVHNLIVLLLLISFWRFLSMLSLSFY